RAARARAGQGEPLPLRRATARRRAPRARDGLPAGDARRPRHASARAAGRQRRPDPLPGHRRRQPRGVGPAGASGARRMGGLATGVGERLRALPDPEPYGVLVLRLPAALSTADVYREADRLGLPRNASGLADRLEAAERALAGGGELPDDLICNDLQDAARAL